MSFCILMVRHRSCLFWACSPLTKDGQKEIDSRYVKTLPIEGYIQCFQQKANEYYPFLSEPYEGESIKIHTKEEYMKAVLDSLCANSDIKKE